MTTIGALVVPDPQFVGEPVNASVHVPTLANFKSENVATPLTALRVNVPVRPAADRAQ